MKVLMLTPYLPFPPSSGGQIRSFNLIKYLSKKHDITLFSLIKDEKEKKYIPELEKYCKKVRVFRRSKSPWTLRNILLTAFGPFPFLAIRNLAPRERSAVKKELLREKYDLIHAETFSVMLHIPETKTPVLMVEQTIEYLVYKHFVEKQSPLFLRPILSIDVAKLRYWESQYWRKADTVVAVSETDRDQMKKLVSKLDVDIVPNGVDLGFFKVKKKWKDKNPRILFVANFKWMQNVEAAQLLIKKVFPLVQKRLPEARLWIVGQYIPDEIKSEKSKKIIVDDLKESDEESVKNAYFQASIFVSPLRGPGGTRLKHFAAMAAKLPLVTTTVGAEGLDAKDGKHISIRNNPKGIAETTVDLLKNSDKAKKIADNARTLVKEKFSWSKIAKHLDSIYQETAYGKKT